MIKLSAVVLVLAGVSIGSYAMLSGNPIEALGPQPASVTVAVAPVPAAVVKERPPPAPPVPLSPSAATSDPPRTMTTAGFTPRIPVALHAPSSGTPPDTSTLAREIQLQLKRVGCYQGPIHGVWSPAVSRSMKAFADHVNAKLPVEHPDIILLALVQNHRGSACGVPCPAGQARAEHGRCLPHALIARIAKKKLPANADLIKTSVPMPRAAPGPSVEEPLSGERMSLGASSLPPKARPEARRKRPARRPAYAQARARQAWKRAVTPYSHYPRWAARAFEQL